MNAPYQDPSLPVAERVADLARAHDAARRRSGRCCSSTPGATSRTSSSTCTSARSCTPRPERVLRGARADRADPAADPAARRRGLHPRPLVLARARRSSRPSSAWPRTWDAGPARAGRPGHRGRGRRDRHPLDLLAGAVHRPRPALGPGRARRSARTRSSSASSASAMVRGYQGDGLTDPTAILATAKHFAGYSETQGGRDASEADISRRKLRVVVPAAVRAGGPRGLPHVHARLPVDGRRADHRQRAGCSTTCCAASGATPARWSPTGTTSAGWSGSSTSSPTTRTPPAAAVRAGNDMVMTTPGFFEGAQEAVARGPARRGRPRRGGRAGSSR